MGFVDSLTHTTVCNVVGCESSNLVGDGYCHDEANNFQCGFDRGDCCYTCTSNLACTDCECLTGNAGQDKSDLLNGNGYCNDEMNNDECGYDGGDCCLSELKSDYCSECTCYGQDTCAALSSAGLKLPSLVGDRVCNDETNNAECNYDGGDCCLYNMNTYYCSECNCYDQGKCAVGLFPLVGNGNCNDETNTVECNYDDGDCCLSETITDHCSECICYGQEICKAGIIPQSIGDGICNDETNNAECNYDGYDCCKSPANKDHCSNCECIGKLNTLY